MSEMVSSVTSISANMQFPSLETPGQEQAIQPATSASDSFPKSIRPGDQSVFKPVNAAEKGTPTSPSSLSGANSPTSPYNTTNALSSAPCDTPRPNKTPSESSSRHKRTFGTFSEGAHREDKEDEDCHSSAATPLCSRPSRSCKDVSIKRIRRAVEVHGDGEEEDSNPNIDSKGHNNAYVAKHMDKITIENRQKGPCSYEFCPNPHHSSGGGFKVVTHETKAGNRDWHDFTGRVFCNACFTQYATRGTFQRPGRQLPIPQAPAPRAGVSERHAVERSPYVAEAPKPRPLPAPRLPTLVEIDEAYTGKHHGVFAVELTVQVEGRNVSYQWIRDGRAIPGGVKETLKLAPHECVGEITCRVANEYGVAPLFAPVRLPIAPEDAKRKFGNTIPAAMPKLPIASHYKLVCVCGKDRSGTPMELVEPCECGLACCGRVEPIYSEEQQVQVQAVEAELRRRTQLFSAHQE